MYHVASWNWDFENGGDVASEHANGFARASLVSHESGAVHTYVGLSKLAPGGRLRRHVRSIEECAYVLSGDPVVELGDRSFQLHRGHYVLFPVGTPHGWRNEGKDEAHLLEVASPQPEPAGTAQQDTFFLPRSQEPAQAARTPDLEDPTTRLLGHYLGTPRQAEALALDETPRGRAPAGMDTALLAYSGISIKMLVDATLGADLLTMFMVDYEPRGAAQVHDHPFEEVYFFLEGEIEGEIEGKVQTFRAGEVLFCGVGADHGFFNTSDGRVRWIETQAPQPPRRHSYRWPTHWERLKDRIARGQYE